jgi:hypothetical protein
MSTSPDTKTLDIFKGLVVNDTVEESEDKSWLIVVGGWQSNTITSSDQSGIAWGYGNVINGQDNAAIGGGNGNHVSWEIGVVAWWKGNTSEKGWVVLWWQSNTANGKLQDGVIIGGIVLWWKGNTAGVNGLAMWQWAIWGDWSFVWNDDAVNTVTAASNSARIWAQNWVLIGTYTPKDGVSLVVNWPVQIWNNNSVWATATAWEIRSVEGCLYAYDGDSWHILGKSSVGDCKNKMTNLANTCEFGRVLLQEWDKVDAYSMRYHPSYGCETSDVKTKVVCTNWQLIPENGGDANKYIYPSCYNLSGEPYSLPEN